MPKHRKTRKQKLQASIRPNPVSATVVPPTSSVSLTTPQISRSSENFSLNLTKMQNKVTVMGSHAYLRPELTKTAMLSAAIIVGELLLFFLLRNHTIVLFNVSY